MAKELKLPEVGEDVEEATVLKINVEKGQQIEKDDVVAEIETDKATLEVPAEAAGTVTEIRIKEGDEIAPGDVLLILDGEESGGDGDEDAEEESKEKKAKPSKDSGKKDKKAEKPKPKKEEPSEKEEAEEDEKDEKTAGKKEDAEKETDEEASDEEASEDEEAGEEEEASGGEKAPKKKKAEKPEKKKASGESRKSVPAAPSVRRFAREIGVDVNQVRGTGPGGRISDEDVKRHAREGAPSGGGGAAAPEAPELPDFSQWGEVRREKMSAMRKTIARRMSEAWRTIPHVHHFEEADVSELEVARSEYNELLDEDDVPVTMTAIVLRALAHMLRAYPMLNASLDVQAGEIVHKDYVHVGVAVDTPRGLLVPVLRDADEKSVRELGDELAELARRARDRKLSREEMEGASFTLSNVGGIGGTQFTPIINPPNVAILGVARSQMRVVMVDDAPEERLYLPLSLGYDHRLIDGATAARFLRDLAGRLTRPIYTLFEI